MEALFLAIAVPANNLIIELLKWLVARFGWRDSRWFPRVMAFVVPFVSVLAGMFPVDGAWAVFFATLATGLGSIYTWHGHREISARVNGGPYVSSTLTQVYWLSGLTVFAFSLAIGPSSGCSSSDSFIQDVALAGHCDAVLGLDTRAGDVRIRVVSGVDYTASNDLEGYGKVCAALESGGFLCWVVVEECPRDEQGFCRPRADPEEAPPDQLPP